MLCWRDGPAQPKRQGAVAVPARRCRQRRRAVSMAAERRQGKAAFVDALSRAHRRSLERFLASKLDNPEDAADVAQEAFLRIQRLRSPQQLDNPRAFLFQVAANLAVDELRRRTLRQRFLKSELRRSPGEAPAPPDSGGLAPEEILDARERLRQVYAAIDSLPDKCRQAFLLHRNAGLSYADIARELGVSVSSVEKYILRALKHCRAALARYYDRGPPPGKGGQSR